MRPLSQGHVFILHTMRTLFRLGSLVSLLAAILTTTFAADNSVKSYDLPSSDAATVLKQFSEISGRETLFAAEVVRDVRTQSIKGNYTAQDAISRILAGTGLSVVIDEKTGAFAIRKNEKQSIESNFSKAIPVATTSSGEGTAVKLKKYEVLGTRISQTDVEGPSPVSTYTAETIESSGALTLSDFLATVPQTYGGISVGRNSAPNDLNLTFGQRSETVVPLAPAAGSSPTAVAPAQTGVSGVGLRSLGSGSTLVLVDGQRMAQSPSANRDTASGQGFVDVNLIPLGLIDHIEITTDGASAIYGADAVAGVINIVLKKNWSGAELSASFKDTQHGGGNERQSTLVVGFSADKGKFHGTVAVNYYQRDSMMASQRDFSSNLNHSSIIKGYNPTSGAPVFGYDLRLQYGYPATVYAVGGFTAIPGVSYAVTPSGFASTPTVAQFIPKTTIAPGQTTLSGQGQNVFNEAPYIEMIPWASRHGFMTNFSYNVWHNIEIFATAGATDTRGIATTMLQYVAPSTLYVVPAAYNPFNQSVQVGMALPTFGVLTQRTHTTDTNATVGIKGKLASTWQWDGSLRWDRQVINQMNRNFNSGMLTANLANGTFNPFIDATASGAPNMAAVSESMAIYPYINSSSSLKAGSFNANGELFNLPGGAVKMAFGGTTEQDYDLYTSVAVSAAVVPVSTPTVYQTLQRINALYAELSVPVFGKNNAIPLFGRFDLNAAGRYEYQDLNVGSKTVPKYGFTWSLIDSLMLRGSYSEGWRPPAPTENRAVSQILATSGADPSRGNVVSSYSQIRGPNPNLKAETSTTKFVGAVYNPKFINGLSLNVNYYTTVQKDAIQTITSAIVLANPALFPNAIVRSAPTASDTAANQPGALISVANFMQNYGSLRNDSIDYGLDYRLPWKQYGAWRVSADSSHTLKAIRALTPGQASINDIGDTYGGPKWKINSGVYWNSGSWKASALYSYLSAFTSNLSDVNYLAWNQKTPAISKIDTSVGYRFKGGVWGGYGKDLQVNFGISNLLDKAPPFSDTIYSYNPALHSELVFGRTYQLSFKLPL